MLRKELLARVYRLPPFNRCDFTELHQAIGPFQKHRRPDTVLTDGDLVRLDFFTKLLRPGRLLSFVDAVPTLRGRPVKTEEKPEPVELTVCLIVTGTIVRKNVQYHPGEQMRLPIFVQFFTPVPQRTLLWERIVISTTAPPRLQDGMGLIPWSCVSTVRVWDAKDNHEEIPLQVLTGCKMLKEIWPDPDDEHYPVLYLLEHLKDAGWRTAVSVKEHNSECKVLPTRGVGKRPQYLRCLWRLPELLTTMQSLSARQHERYYECVLRLPEPHAIPLGKRVKDYVKMLEDAGVTPASTFTSSAETADPDEDEDNEAGEGNESEDEFWVAGPEEEADAAAAAEGQPVGDDASVSGSQRPVEGGEQANVDLSAVGMPTLIRGCRVGLDNFGAYRRAFIECPQGRAGHKEGQLVCRKYRNLGERQQASFGVLEVAAYLGAWADAHSRFSVRSAHVKYCPKTAEVEAFARSQNWL